jgi:ribonuclease E
VQPSTEVTAPNGLGGEQTAEGNADPAPQDAETLTPDAEQSAEQTTDKGFVDESVTPAIGDAVAVDAVAEPSADNPADDAVGRGATNVATGETTDETSDAANDAASDATNVVASNVSSEVISDAPELVEVAAVDAVENGVADNSALAAEIRPINTEGADTTSQPQSRPDVDADHVATPTNDAVAAETVQDAPPANDEPPKPKRRGWWSLGS